MNDIIQLLPDNIANQIAAGEVIQRPSSVVKELLENAIDAGATEIKLILKDAGKSLIQVIDNGKGMSVTDARLSFERHATSKIKEANDLFHIKTMGFRGEALASIGSIAQVEMITRRSVDEVGNRLVMEGSKMTKQEPVQAAIGTSISVKNLFYNIPARRKFLKSDPVELKHVMDDFQRVALAYPEIFFSMYHNQHENFHLGKNNLRQRIISIVGKHVNEKLIPVQEQTDLVNISGFIVKPEGCKRTKGDQYLFVNRRFIKSNNLYHAIKTGYESLLQAEQYPGYFLFLDIDPSAIDINVHPTKTEIKFEDERLIYNYLKVCIKHGLGQYSLAPMLDFNSDSNFNHAEKYILQNQMGSDEYHHPSLASHSAISSGSHRSTLKKETLKSWEDMYEALHQSDPKNDSSVTFMEDENQKGIEAEMSLFSNEKLSVKTPFQIHQSYVVTQIKSGLLIIDQQAAHERILYEHYKNLLSNGEFVSQKELFPRVVELDGSKASVLKEILPFVNALGFEISDFGNNSFIVHGTPSGLEERIPLESLLSKIIEQYLINYEFDFGIEDNLSRSMAWSSCIKKGKVLEIQEMIQIIDQLFACEIPYKSPSGKNCFITLELDEIQRRFNF
ncbi:MAG: DNA mismatch repair endonuclease MutL [Saprospiraceae bacterium]|nr:DNA mismatch repair endonuclease MutL [Saprospiraceae bacterium]